MEPEARTSRRGELWGWVVMTALGCLLVLWAAGQAWVTVLGDGAATEAPSGGELSPVLSPVALAGLAGVVAVLATKGAGRRAVGALLALCGAGAAVAAWAALSGDTVSERLREQNVLSGAAGLSWEVAPLWPAVTAAGAILVTAGGVLAVLRGGRWAGMSARYDRAAGEPSARVSDDRALWDALDRGDDPTDHPTGHR
ncbi:hypothetical protein FE391_31650 [Nonomuraea sp. KC401]|uniref:Trp biosynthesis-associated membrane protein n=1 Tax=unclassified Nonomuraea TaxID=2593643 RepID=UPI0010FE595A|nr:MULTISPECIES: Trp biosynthesis-associated membrane protein [unclassified Nonomuraea]NBE98177.1 hypothetical protein [Nonomuraea sp. K271]TLF61725.1 hypothetical protein FE391_31650 [Nonomuraea sp. KC401]